MRPGGRWIGRKEGCGLRRLGFGEPVFLENRLDLARLGKAHLLRLGERLEEKGTSGLAVASLVALEEVHGEISTSPEG